LRRSALSLETRKKISDARKGMIFTAEHRKHLSEAHKGHHPTMETSRRRSQSMMGHTVSATTRQLLSAKNTGKKYAKNEIGKTYGRLTVLERAGTKNGAVYWLCRCNCGEETIVQGRAFRTGNTRSCGCLQREAAARITRLQPGEAAFRRALAAIKGNARRRGYAFELSDEDARGYMDSPCFYCGEVAANNSKNHSGNGDYHYNGLDRVENIKGYVSGNVVSSCPTCNRAKGIMSAEQFIAHCKTVVDVWTKRRLS